MERYAELQASIGESAEAQAARAAALAKAALSESSLTAAQAAERLAQAHLAELARHACSRVLLFFRQVQPPHARARTRTRAHAHTHARTHTHAHTLSRTLCVRAAAHILYPTLNIEPIRLYSPFARSHAWGGQVGKEVLEEDSIPISEEEGARWLGQCGGEDGMSATKRVLDRVLHSMLLFLKERWGSMGAPGVPALVRAIGQGKKQAEELSQQAAAGHFERFVRASDHQRRLRAVEGASLGAKPPRVRVMLATMQERNAEQQGKWEEKKERILAERRLIVEGVLNSFMQVTPAPCSPPRPGPCSSTRPLAFHPSSSLTCSFPSTVCPLLSVPATSTHSAPSGAGSHHRCTVYTRATTSGAASQCTKPSAAAFGG